MPINPTVNPKTSLVANGAPVTIPENSSGVIVQNFVGSTGDITITFEAGNTWLVKAGCSESLGITTQFCAMVISCPAGTSGQTMWT